jgi:hypothetical protein
MNVLIVCVCKYIHQVELSEEEALRLLNKATPTALVATFPCPDVIDSAVAAYFEQ